MKLNYYNIIWKIINLKQCQKSKKFLKIVNNILNKYKNLYKILKSCKFP